MAARKKKVTTTKKTTVKKVVKKVASPVVAKKKVVKKKAAPTVVVKKKVVKKKAVVPVVTSMADFVSSSQIADEYGIDAQQFRYRVRGRIRKPKGRFWRWAKDSKELLKIRRILDEAALENGEVSAAK